MSNDKICEVGINIAEKATVIWNVADMLRGPFKPHEYGLVILPMTEDFTIVYCRLMMKYLHSMKK